MIALLPLRWLLTAAFATTSVFHLMRCLRPGRHPAAERLSEVLHLVMGGSMIAMLWPAQLPIPAPVWAALFGAATGWFLARAIPGAEGRTRHDCAERHRSGFVATAGPGFFASASAVMVWMAVAMPAGAASGRTQMVMPAMAMDHAADAGVQPPNGWAPNGWAPNGWASGGWAPGGWASGVGHPGVWISVGFGVYFVVAACVWAANGLRLAPAAAVGPEPIRWPAVCHGVMSAGMGLTLLAAA